MTGMGFDYFSLVEPGAPALVDPSGKIWSRAELFALANRLSRALRAAGLEKGNAVAVLAPNCAEFLAAHLAATQAGLYLVPINWHLSPSEVAYILEDSGAAAVIVHGRLAGAVLAAVKAATTGARAYLHSWRRRLRRFRGIRGSALRRAAVRPGARASDDVHVRDNGPAERNTAAVARVARRS